MGTPTTRVRRSGSSRTTGTRWTCRSSSTFAASKVRFLLPFALPRSRGSAHSLAPTSAAEHEHIHGVEDSLPLYYARTPPAYHPPPLPSRSRSSSPPPDQTASSSRLIVSDADQRVHMNQVRAFLAWMDVGFKFRGCGWADQHIQIECASLPFAPLPLSALVLTLCISLADRRQGEGRDGSSSTSSPKRDILELVVRLKGIWRLVKLDDPTVAQGGRDFYVFGLPGADFAPSDSAASALSCPLHEYKDSTGRASPLLHLELLSPPDNVLTLSSSSFALPGRRPPLCLSRRRAPARRVVLHALDGPQARQQAAHRRDGVGGQVDVRARRGDERRVRARQPARGAAEELAGHVQAAVQELARRSSVCTLNEL